MAKKANDKDEDADANVENQETAAEGESKGGKKKLIVMAAAGLVVLLAAGRRRLFLPGRRQERGSGRQEDGGLSRHPRDDCQPDARTAAGPPAISKLKVALEVTDPKLVTTLTPLLPRIEDAFQVYVRELRASDLEGSAGVYRLKEELLRRVNMAVYPSKIDAVLFKEIVVQ